MGRFYKATPGNFIDNKMYETPFEEIAGTIGQIDKNITETYDEGRNILDASESQKLESDDPAVTARFGKYSDIVEQSTIAMDKNPLDFVKHNGKLRKASRDLSTDMKTGIIGRAQEQFETYNKETAELDARTDLTQTTKDLKKSHILAQYKKAGSLNYNQETGAFNKISTFNSDLVGEIVDEDAYLTKVDKGFQFQSEGGGSSRVGKVAGSNDDMLITSSSNRTTRSAARVQSYLEKDLDSKDYVKSRRQIHQMEMDMNGPSKKLNKDGTPMTPQQLAEQDKRDLVAKGVEKLTGSRGAYKTSASGLPGAGTNKKKSTGRVDTGTDIDDTSSTVMPAETIVKTKSKDTKLQRIFDFDSNDIPITNDMTDAEKLPLQNMAASKEKLTKAGFKNAESLYSNTVDGFTLDKLDVLSTALVDSGLLDINLPAFEKRKASIDYLNTKAAQKTRTTLIIPEFNDGVEATEGDILEATEVVRGMVNSTDQTQAVGEIYITEGGKTKKLPSGMSFNDLATKSGAVYIQPTGKGPSSVQEIGSDKNGWKDKAGNLIKAQEANKEKGIRKGQTLSRAYIAENLPDTKIMTQKVAGKNIYNNTKNLIHIVPGDMKQEIFTVYDINGKMKEVKRYVAIAKLLRTNPDGTPGETVSVKIVLDPEDYKTN